MTNSTFGRDLERAREGRGKNGHELARELNVSATSVHKWENNTSFPRPDKWKAIEEATGINPQRYKDKNRYKIVEQTAPEHDNKYESTDNRKIKETESRNALTDEYHSKLQKILRNPKYRSAIIHNLEAFGNAAEGDEEMKRMEEKMERMEQMLKVLLERTAEKDTTLSVKKRDSVSNG